jgi:transcriptional regulator with XRE-family HTH domain
MNNRKEVIKTVTCGERVKEIRKELGLTLEKFGEKLGVKKNALSAIENGRNSLTEQMAKAICREYNVSYDYLINGDGEMFDNLPQTILDELCVQYDLSDFDRMLVEMYVSLPKDLREQAEACITKFLEQKKKFAE